MGYFGQTIITHFLKPKTLCFVTLLNLDFNIFSDKLKFYKVFFYLPSIL